MANENTITIKINADGSLAVNGINQVVGSMKSMETETQSIASKFREHWIGITAAITGAIYSMKKAWDLADQAARFQEQATALNALSSQYGLTSKNIVEKIKEASGGLISMSDAVHVASKALLEGMNPDQLVQFMRLVRETTNVTGDSVANSFERITQASAIGAERALRQMGIIVDLQKAYREYARSVGVTIEQLSEEERQQAGINAILAQGSELMQRLGESTDSVNDKMERFMVMITDMKTEIGNILIRVGAGLITVLMDWEVAIATFIQKITYPFAMMEKGLNLVGVKSTIWQDAYKTWGDAIKNTSEQSKVAFDVMVAKSDELVTAQKNIVTQTERTHVVDPEKERKRVEDVIKLMQELHDREELLNKTADQKDLIQLQQKQRDEMKTLANARASFAQLDEASRIHELESNALLAEQKKKYYEEEMKASEKINQIKSQGIEIQRRGYEEAWNMIMNTNNIIGGQAGQGLGLVGAGLKGIMDIAGGTDVYSKQLADLQDNYNAQIQATTDFYALKLQMMEQAGADEIAIKEQTAAMIASINDTVNQYQAQQDLILVQQKLQGYAMMANMIEGILTGLASFMGKNNSLMFYAQKLFAMANIVISTAMGVASCLANPALWPMIPWVEAMGAAQLAIVAAQTIMGQGKGLATAGRGGGFALQNPTTPSVQREELQKSQIINIYVQGNIVDHDAFARELIPSIQKATSDNVR